MLIQKDCIYCTQRGAQDDATNKFLLSIDEGKNVM
jgi:hypothetical protein